MSCGRQRCLAKWQLAYLTVAMKILCFGPLRPYRALPVLGTGWCLWISTLDG